VSKVDSWYKSKRFEMLCRLSKGHVPSCKDCGKILYWNTDKLHFHHVNQEEGFKSGIGGKQHLLQVIKQAKQGVEIDVLCHRCHAARHEQVLWTPKIGVET